MKVTTLVGRNSLAVRCTRIFMPGVNLPEATRTKAMRSRWLLSMLACTLKTTPEKPSSSGWMVFSSRWRFTSW